MFKNKAKFEKWETSLSANAGVYRIIDKSDYSTYIGSAYGKDGIWGRWSNYAKTGHGTNC